MEREFKIPERNYNELASKNPKYILFGIKVGGQRCFPLKYENVSVICYSYDELLENISKVKEYRVFEIGFEMLDKHQLSELSEQYVTDKKKKNAELEIERLKKENNIQ